MSNKQMHKSSHFNVLFWRVCTVLLKPKATLPDPHPPSWPPPLQGGRMVDEFAPTRHKDWEGSSPPMATAATDLGPSQLWHRGALHIEGWRYADRLWGEYLTLKRLHQGQSRWRETISVLISVLMAPFAKVPVTWLTLHSSSRSGPFTL